MRLFHVSEEPGIQVFEPRLPTRKDLDPNVGLVWAINEQCLPNFLTPRDCPRVAYHIGTDTTEEDRRRFFTSERVSHAVVMEHGWFERMRNTTLYIYEFDPEGFELQDTVAGYYVAKTTQRPIGCREVHDLFMEHINRNVELRVTGDLWKIAEEVQRSSLDWSLCRMRFARQGAESDPEQGEVRT